jgi:flagellar protein FliL
MKFALVAIVLTVIAVGLGGAAGLQVFEIRPNFREAASAKNATIKEEVGSLSRFPKGAVVKPLAPIVTNLGGAKPAWIRLEISLVLAQDNAESQLVAAALAEDFLVFLRTLEIGHIQGANGFQYLRDDLDERARTRTKGKSLGVVLTSLVVE